MERNYLAHVQLRPIDGAAPFTVESQFRAASYAQAWGHISNMAFKFKANILSHKLVEVDEDGVIDTAGIVPTLQEAIAAEMPKPTLTVKDGVIIGAANLPPVVVAAPSWYGSVVVKVPIPIQFPYEQESEHDSATG